MEPVESLKPQALYRLCDPEQFQFGSTAELDDPEGSISQKRAVEGVEFGTAIRREGHNLFALGPAGTGKFKMVNDWSFHVARGHVAQEVLAAGQLRCVGDPLRWPSWTTCFRPSNRMKLHSWC